MGTLDDLRTAGSIGLIGISCDDVECAIEALEDPRVSAIEAPLGVLSELRNHRRLADRRDLFVIGRDILGGHSNSRREMSFHAVNDAACSAVGSGLADTYLFGTTRIEHLRQILEATGELPK